MDEKGLQVGRATGRSAGGLDTRGNNMDRCRGTQGRESRWAGTCAAAKGGVKLPAPPGRGPHHPAPVQAPAVNAAQRPGCPRNGGGRHSQERALPWPTSL